MQYLSKGDWRNLFDRPVSDVDCTMTDKQGRAMNVCDIMK